MVFKSIIGAVCTCLLVVSFSVRAIPSNYVDNGGYTTNTTLGLDWLDLSYTVGVAYSTATTVSVEGGGWRYATNTEVNDLFDAFFPNWTADDSFSYSLGAATTQNTLFGNLFGGRTVNGISYTYLDTYGLYEDETSVLRMMGTHFVDMNDVNATDLIDIYGPDYIRDYTLARNSTRFLSFGSYLVRDISTVPEPPLSILLASGLIAFGVVRRKSRA